MKPGALELLDLLDELRLPRAIATTSPTVLHHLKAAGHLGVAPRLCLALEDSHNGVRSASAAGMMTVMVPDLLPPTVEIQGLCLHVVPDLHHVHRLIVGAVA